MTYRFIARPACPGCGSTATAERYSARYADAPVADFVRSYYPVEPETFGETRYRLDRCADCTLLFQHWIGDEDFLAQLYGEWIESDDDPEAEASYREDIHAVARSRDAHEIVVASAHLGLAPEDMVTLDYGMGWALWARIAAKLGCKSHGSDLSPRRMAFAREHGIVTLDDEAIAEPRFHFINLEQVLEHVPEPVILAEKLGGALLPGGILKVSVPNGADAERILEDLKSPGAALSDERWMPVQPLEHINTFSAKAVEALAARAGLHVIEPSLSDRYAFVREPGSLAWSRPAKLAKELIRPIYQFHSRRNLYRWLEKPAAKS